MQSPIQSSLSSPSQDHGYCSNTNNGAGPRDERQILEHNLERLISERGMEVIGQLTKEMSPQQIERLLAQTKEKLHATNSAPLSGSNITQDSSIEQQHSRSRKPLVASGSMTDVFKKQSSSDEEDCEDLDMPDKSAMSKKGIMNNKHPNGRLKDSRMNGSAKNLSVRFDPSQVQTSPHMEHMSRRGHHGGSHHGHHHKKSHHHHHSSRSRRAMSRQPERSYHYHQPMIPRYVHLFMPFSSFYNLIYFFLFQESLIFWQCWHG